MYSPIELRTLTVKPKINDISLEILRQYYEMFLNPFVYIYTVTYQKMAKQIELRFDIENFCHLLGIESVAKKAVSYAGCSQYRGRTGWDNIEDGIVTIKHLRKLNNKQFQNIKAKQIYFYLLPDLLENPMAVQFDKNKVVPSTRMECELLFYSAYDNVVIHLGIEKDKSKQYYFSRTFFVEKLDKEGCEDIYTVNQEKITVKKNKR